MQCVRGFVVDGGGPFVEVELVEAAFGLEGELEAVEATGAGGVELGDELVPERWLLVGEELEHVQGVGGDGEGDEWGDGGGEQWDRSVERQVGGGFGGAAFVGGLVAVGELAVAPGSGDSPVAVI